MKRNSKWFWFIAVIAVITSVMYFAGADTVGKVLFAVAPVGLVSFAKKEEDMTDEEKKFCGTIQKQVSDIMESYTKGFINADTLEAKLKEVMDNVNKKSGEGMDELKKTLEEQRADIKQMAEGIEKFKKNGGSAQRVSVISEKLNEFFESPRCKDYFEGREKSTGAMTLDLKAIDSDSVVSMNGNIATPYANNLATGRVVTDSFEQQINVRDLMMVDQGDPQHITLTYEQIYAFDRNAKMVSENGRLSESSLKVKEMQTGLSRVGTFMNLSKRMLKAKAYLLSFILNRLPSWVMLAENYQFLYGDGNGDNLKGITKYDGVNCVSKFITGTVVTLAAGDISTIVANADKNAAIVTLKNANDKLIEGYKVTFAGAVTNTALNGTFIIHKITDAQFSVDCAMTADEADASKVSGTVKTDMFNSVDAPDYGDAISAIYAVLNFAQYHPNGIVLNPSTVFAIQTAKDTTGRNLGLVTQTGGRKYVCGIPIVENNSINPGYYLAGDFANAASIVQYSNLNIEMADDVEMKLKNMTCVMISEELIFPVYMPWAFAYGRLSDVLTAIKKA
jgi:HK97 family phage major capsid protein